MSDQIRQRIASKQEGYLSYGFTQKENNAVKTFFDVAQEVDSLDDLHALTVTICREFFGLDARLYVCPPDADGCRLVASSTTGEEIVPELPPEKKPREKNLLSDGAYLLPLRPRGPGRSNGTPPSEEELLGVLEVFPVTEGDLRTQLFLDEYANRVAIVLQNRIVAARNVEHLRFINTLVADIEHNVIVPNMVFKLYLRNLRGLLGKNDEVEKSLAEIAGRAAPGDEAISNILLELADANRGLRQEWKNMESHYANTSLFLETLFRESHFDYGRLTLRSKPCNMKRDVLVPQIERYRDRFESVGIEVDDRFSYLPEEEVITVVDVGLIAQVYANLFSNAVKYTQEIRDDQGRMRKYISYGRELMKDYFGPGRDGIKYNVYSTGSHINEEDRPFIYTDGFRGKNVGKKPGTGHGLSFVQKAVEIHGGVVGYEPTWCGNNFFFILPD